MTAFNIISNKKLFVGRENSYLLGETTRHRLSTIGPYLSCVQLSVTLPIQGLISNNQTVVHVHALIVGSFTTYCHSGNLAVTARAFH